MSAVASRRAAIGAILAAPLVTVPAQATGAVSPELVRLIRRAVAASAANDRAVSEDRFLECLMRGAGQARAALARFTPRTMPDLIAKAQCCARLWGDGGLQEQVDDETSGDTCYLDELAVAVLLDLVKLSPAALETGRAA